MTLTKTEEAETVTTFSDPEQILHLKRLLVTLKQQYEKGLQQLNSHLQKEQAKVFTLTKRMELFEGQQSEIKKQHEEELDALRKQIIALRELSKRQDGEEVVYSPELEVSRERIEQLERVIPYMQERVNEAKLETEQLRDELGESRRLNEELKSILQDKENDNLQFEKHIHCLQNELEHERRTTQNILEEKQREIEIIANEKKSIEYHIGLLNAEFEELLKEKLNLEHQIPNLHTHIEHQSKYITELKTKLQDQILCSRAHETLLHEKERSLSGRESEFQLLSTQQEEAESLLKVAQHHLAKKVKEATLLAEKIEQMQSQLNESLQAAESNKAQALQLQAALDQRQSNENRLQEQLKEAMKNFELQNIKWEEKYYKTYDRWQECENRIRELQKLEEKHYQMQGILANLGSFMIGTDSVNLPPSLAGLAISAQQGPANPQEKLQMPSFFTQQDGGAFLEEQQDLSNGHFDLFGMQINRQKSS